MKKILEAVSKISLASASNIVAGVIRTKFFALVLGATGIGIVSQLTSFSGLVMFVSTAGIPIGITKLVSEFEKENKWQEIYDILNKSLFFLISIGIISLVLTLFFSEAISFLILDSNSYSNFLIIMAFAFPFSVAIIVFDAYLRGLKRFGHYVKITILNSITTLVLTVVLVYYYSIYGFAVSILLSSIFNISLYIFFLHKDNLIVLSKIRPFRFKLSGPVKLIMRLGAASMALGILDQLTLLFIRSVLVKSLGIETNGIYQCVAGISNNYFAIFYMSISTYILPILSEKKDYAEVNSEINNAYKLTLLLIIPITTFTFVSREFIIQLLYSDKFLSAADLMLYNFAGDFFKALSWVFGAWLIPASRIRIWLLIGILYYVNYIVVFLFLNVFGYDVKNVVIAYAFAGLIHLVLNLIYIKKYNRFKFQTGNVKVLLFSILVLTAIFGISSYNLNWGYIGFVPLLLTWLFYSVRKDEFMKLFALLVPKR